MMKTTRKLTALLLALCLCLPPVTALAAEAPAAEPGGTLETGTLPPPDSGPDGEATEPPAGEPGTSPADPQDPEEPEEVPENTENPEPPQDPEDPEAPQPLRDPVSPIRPAALPPGATSPGNEINLTGLTVGDRGDWEVYSVGVVELKTAGPFTITGSNSNVSIRVTHSGGPVEVTLQDAAVTGLTMWGHALDCSGNRVDLWLEGTNTLDDGNGNGAALACGSGAVLAIGGSGSLTATGINGAGIGGGNGQSAGTITIAGGAVTAVGGNGAGIGGGHNGDGGTVRITGGTVIATGSSGAGIGGGAYGDGGSLQITGGRVTASSQYGGAGIGGGNGSITGGAVVIAGSPEVLATGGRDSVLAQPGDGIQADSLSVNLTGGSLAAVGGPVQGSGTVGGSGINVSGAASITLAGGRLDASGGDGAAATGGHGLWADSLDLALSNVADLYTYGGDGGLMGGSGIRVQSGDLRASLEDNASLAAVGGDGSGGSGGDGIAVAAGTLWADLDGGEVAAFGGEANGLGLSLSGSLALGGYGQLQARGGSGGHGLDAASITAVEFTVTGVPGTDREVSFHRVRPSTVSSGSAGSGSGSRSGSSSERTAALAVTGWPESMEVGERVVLTASQGGGTWSFDGDLLAVSYPDTTFLRNPATFTALAPGIATVTYQLGAQSITRELRITGAAAPPPAQAGGAGGNVNDNPGTGGTKHLPAAWTALLLAAGALAWSRRRL